MSGKAAAAPPAKQATKPKSGIGPFDEQTLEIGGGAIALLIFGAGAFTLSRRNRNEDVRWDEEDLATEARDPLFDEPMFQNRRPTTEASAFAWGPESTAQERESETA